MRLIHLSYAYGPYPIVRVRLHLCIKFDHDLVCNFCYVLAGIFDGVINGENLVKVIIV